MRLKSGGLQPGGLQLLEPPIRELDNQTPVGASSLGAYIWVLRLNPSHLDFATKVWGPTAWGPTVIWKLLLVSSRIDSWKICEINHNETKLKTIRKHVKTFDKILKNMN